MRNIMVIIKYHKKTATLYVFALALCILWGKQYMSWNNAIAKHDLWLYFLCVNIAFIMYFVWTCNFSEMISMVNFSGGCYGYSRCALGPPVGYLAGCLEAMKYMIYNVVNVYFLGTMFQDIYDFEDKWLAVIWLAFYVISCLFMTVDTKVLVGVYQLLGLVIFTIVLIYICGAMRVGEVENISRAQFVQHGDDMLETFSSANAFFTGIDAVRTGTSDQSNKIVPWAMVNIMVLDFITALATIIAGRSYVRNANELGKGNFAYNVGLVKALKGIDPRFVSFFSLAGVLGSALGFLYVGARQVRSMAGSGLLPPILATGQKDEEDAAAESVVPAPASSVDGDKGERAGAAGDMMSRPSSTKQVKEPVDKKEARPVLAMLACAFFSYVLLVSGHFTVRNFRLKVQHMASLLSCCESIFLQTAYLVFATRFSGMNRDFRSPFGMIGAIVVTGYFSMVCLVYLIYDNDNEGLGISLMIFVVVCMIYYVVVASKRQFFSKEEQDKFMRAYITNANRSKKKVGSKSRNNSNSTILQKVLSNVLPAAVFSSSRMSRKSSKGGGGASDSAKSHGSVGSMGKMGGNNKVTPVKDGGVGGGGGLVVIRESERVRTAP